ncbi:MAG: hypothetical protein DRH06_10730, partial [Deltaproteobacteria bacterium]
MVSGVENGITYYARSIDDFTIQVFASEEHAVAAGSTGLINITRSEIRIVQRPDVASQVGASTGSFVFLGSEADITIASIVAGPIGNRDSEVRIKTKGGIYSSGNPTVTNIIGGDLILEAARAGIGADGAALTLDMSLAARLTARAEKGIFISELDGDLYVDTIFSPERIDLFAEGSILDAFAGNYLNIRTETLNLSAGTGAGDNGSIGTADNFLDINLYAPGIVNARADEDIYLFETAGDMNVGTVISNFSDVSLRAAVSIFDQEDELIADVTGNNITLEAQLGGIGATGNDLDIDSSYSASGNFNSTSVANVYLTEVDGDLRIDQITTDAASTAFIGSDGAILNGRFDDEDNLISGSAWLFADGNIGADSHLLRTSIGRLEGLSVHGGVYLLNTGHVAIGGVGDGYDGIVAEGFVQIIASSPVTVSESVVAAGIHIVATDDDIDGTPATNDDLIVEDGVTLNAFAGDITLCAGDDLIVSVGSTLTATESILLTGDCTYPAATYVADAAGSVIDLQGVIEASTLIVSGGSDNDTVILTHLAANMPATINLGAGDDQLSVGSMATELTNSGGVVEGILSLLTVNGGAGIDTLSVDDSGDDTDQSMTFTSSLITGLGMAEGIAYATVEQIDIASGSGNNTVNVQSTLEGTGTTIIANAGDDTFNISSDAPINSGTLDGIDGELHLDGGAGDNTLNISDRGNSSGLTGVVLDETGISGLGDSGSGNITYEASGSFGGGLNFGFGSGDDNITVIGTRPAAVTTLHMGAGNDSVEIRDESAVDDGLLVIFGEAGDDNLSGSTWNSDLILLGDSGTAIYNGEKNSENLRSIATDNATSGGSDMLQGGSGNDVLLGGLGAD